MAMTKAEQQRVADLEKGLAMARALRWPEYNMPAPLTRGDKSLSTINIYAQAVEAELKARAALSSSRSDQQ